nr:uncharacterized protein LOC121119733 [Lepeophtheirus salmonis]
MEREQLVTVLYAINAGSSAVRPFYVFPWVKVNPAFLNGALPGQEAAATKSGWMNSEIFSHQYLPFFIRQTRCSKDRQVLLIMDNHESHVSLKAITTAKEQPEQLETAVAEEPLTATQPDQPIDNPEQLKAATTTNQPMNLDLK